MKSCQSDVDEIAISARRRFLLGAVQLSQFGAYGIVSLLLNIGVTVFLHEIAKMPVRYAYPFGLTTAVVANFYFCRSRIFHSDRKALPQFFVFIGASLTFRGLEYAVFIVQELLVDIPYVFAIILIQAGSFFIKFFFYKSVLFTNKG